MFAYCNNNPALYEDPRGYALWPTTVAVNDGGYSGEGSPVVNTDNDPKSSSLKEYYLSQPKPASEGLIFADLKRDGHYVDDAPSGIDLVCAGVGLGCLFCPGPFEDIWYLKLIGVGCTAKEAWDNVLTLSGNTPKPKIEDRYSVTETWTTVERFDGRNDFYKQITHCSISYYYPVPEEDSFRWVPCGYSHSFTESIIIVG